MLIITRPAVTIALMSAGWIGSACGAETTQNPGTTVRITSKTSLIHLPNNQNPPMSAAGSAAAEIFYKALNENDRKAANDALAAFQDLIPKEKFGNEYTAFAWFSQYLLADPKQQAAMLSDPVTACYFELLSRNNFEILKNFLKAEWAVGARERVDAMKAKTLETSSQEKPEKPEPVKKLRVLFGLEPQVPQVSTNDAPANNQPASSPPEAGQPTVTAPPPAMPPPRPEGIAEEDVVFWKDFILFNNPNRSLWEDSEKILSFAKINKGEAIADIGCGPGYFSFKFSGLVGPAGKVFAIDTNERHLAFLGEASTKIGTANITTVQSQFDNISIPKQSVDCAFMCSLYSVVYLVSIEGVKDRFVQSIKDALKPGGRLIIVDNNAVVPGGIPYHGARIDPELIIAQLKQYGFELLHREQIVPQRYALAFTLKDSPETPAGEKSKEP